jgi:hypothetical protein
VHLNLKGTDKASQYNRTHICVTLRIQWAGRIVVVGYLGFRILLAEMEGTEWSAWWSDIYSTDMDWSLMRK